MREESIRRRPGIVVLVGVSAAIALVLAAAPEGDSLAEDPPLAALTRDLVIAFTGTQPERCVFAAPGRELCTWQLPGRMFRPNEVAPAKGVNLVCELPLGPGADLEDASGACRAHPRTVPAGDLPAVSAAAGPMRDPGAELAEARTATSISHFLGDGPKRCRTRRDDQLCDWEVESTELGHAPLARLARAASGRIRLRCQLPLDGSPRRPSSCDVRALD